MIEEDDLTLNTTMVDSSTNESHLVHGGGIHHHGMRSNTPTTTQQQMMILQNNNTTSSDQSHGDPLDLFDLSGWTPPHSISQDQMMTTDSMMESSSSNTHGKSSGYYQPSQQQQQGGGYPSIEVTNALLSSSPQHNSNSNYDHDTIFSDPSVAGGRGSGNGSVIMNNNNSSSSSLPLRKHIIPTIATIYEPKFYEIYCHYQQYLDQQHFHYTDVNNNQAGQQHLMTLCLNNLLPFALWARESSTTTQWIRSTLFDNPDMRPEVRNGLALILVYTFSSARAADIREEQQRSGAMGSSVSSGNNNVGLSTSSQSVSGQTTMGGNTTTTNATTNAAGVSSPPTQYVDMFAVLMKHDTGLGIVNKTSLKIYSDPCGFFNFLKVN